MVCGNGKLARWRILFFQVIKTRSACLAGIWGFLCFLKSQRILCVSFRRILGIMKNSGFVRIQLSLFYSLESSSQLMVFHSWTKSPGMEYHQLWRISWYSSQSQQRYSLYGLHSSSYFLLCPFISSNPCTNPLVTILSAPIISVIFMFLSFFSIL